MTLLLRPAASACFLVCLFGLLFRLAYSVCFFSLLIQLAFLACLFRCFLEIVGLVDLFWQIGQLSHRGEWFIGYWLDFLWGHHGGSMHLARLAMGPQSGSDADRNAGVRVWDAGVMATAVVSSGCTIGCLSC